VADQLESHSVLDDHRRHPATDVHGADTADTVALLPLWFERGLVVVTAAMLGFGGFGLLLSVVGKYHILLTLAVGSVLTILACTLAWPRHREVAPVDAGSTRGVRYPAIGMCIIALGFAVGNGQYAGHHATIGRDPGVYAVTGKWIAEHGNLEVPVDSGWAQAAATQVLPGTYIERADRLEFQFNHLTPVLLGEAENIGGDRLLFRVPAVLGALALCAVYAFGCRFVRQPWLVLGAVTALAVSLPQLNVARDTYSEPSVELLLWSGLWLTLVAYRRKRLGVAVLAGAALGGTMLSRVDAFVYLVPFPVLAVLAVLVTKSPADRREMVKLHAGVLVGLLPVAALGTVDVSERAGQYYADLHSQIHELWLGMAGSVLLAGVLLVVAPLLSPRAAGMRAWLAPRRSMLAKATAFVLVLGMVAAWVIRPAVMHGHTIPTQLVAGLQNLERLPVDPTRTYSEYSLTWISWYIGPATLTLSIIGLAVVVAGLWFRRDPASSLVLTVAGLGTAIYLWNPSIVPDQIWAMRRFVPAAMPLIVLLAAASIAALGNVMTTSTLGATWQRTVVAVGALSLFMFPLGTTLPVARFEPQAGDLNVVKATCNRVGPQGAILFAANDSAGTLFPASIRTWCKVPVAVMTRPQTPVELQRLGGSWKAEGRQLWVVGATREAIATSAPGVNGDLVASVANPLELEMTIQRAPRAYAKVVLEMYAGPVSS